MLARLERELPRGDWAYEPKWDGFRCLVFRGGDDIVLQSRNGRALTRYFPEVVAALQAVTGDAVLDGELLLDAADDFPSLLARIHPAASRVRLLSTQTPARFVAFDCLALGPRIVMSEPFATRRTLLEQLLAAAPDRVQPTPLTTDRDEAQQWFDHPQAGWDGVVAKQLGCPYTPGARTMRKVKPQRSADCVVAGVRPGAAGPVSSLLLGLWTPDGTLHHPGVVSSPPRAVKTQLAEELPALQVPLETHPWRGGFGLEGGTTGRLKGAGGRWVPGMTQDWLPIAPRLVAEVGYDRLDGLRFRHPARFRHWRPDRDPATCLVDQLVVGR